MTGRTLIRVAATLFSASVAPWQSVPRRRPRPGVPISVPVQPDLARRLGPQLGSRLLRDRLQPRLVGHYRSQGHRRGRGCRNVVIASHRGSAHGYCNLVKIDHGGSYYTYYAHLNNIVVDTGANKVVSAGQVIGTVGNTSRPGAGDSPHLHYEVRYGGSSQSNIIPAVFNGRTFGTRRPA